ncbi:MULTISPECIES: glycosyltransferase [Fusobacterium]|uniref:glycosyltransferase n=1 Tax=Fusobacterium TaxID=848 RepID=UPI0008A29574|nr:MULTISPECIES: glycosyltransferase [Fusobacterium]OFL81847.1 hypothetical protein HMPREF2747_12830 [Fusobacterium sp. HMSC073F01]
MEKNVIKISVIIPVYNVEEYIEQCVESVVNQTLKEIEIIIVNDGTLDNSMKKIERFLSDKRIIVINKGNGGLSSARNAGLEIARGEYISFVDSDDFIEENMLKELYNGSERADIVFSNIVLFDELTKKKKKRKNICDELAKENKGYYFWRYMGTEVWNKIYKRAFLKKENIKFVENILYEDIPFGLYSLFLASKVKYINKYHYYYRVNRENSIMNMEHKKEKLYISIGKILEEISKLKIKIKNNKFIELRLDIWQFYYINDRQKLIGEKIENYELKNFEQKVKEKHTKNFSRIEKIILKEDMNKLIKANILYDINIFDKFYWKNNLLSLDSLRRIIKYKMKK